MDVFSRGKRSKVMSRIRGRDTRPELLVRQTLSRMRFRFIGHASDLPGRPDFALPRHRAVILVHGCFWHVHRGCRYATSPSSNSAFWRNKLALNVARDARNEKSLRRMGWRVLVVWECALRSAGKRAEALAPRIRRWIISGRGRREIPRFGRGASTRR